MKTLLEKSLIMCIRQNLVVSLVLAISMVGVSYGAGGNLPGNGASEATAYMIEDLADFDVFADQANAATYWSSGVYTKLVCDPNLAGRSYITAVIAPNGGSYFEGVFDGNGHVISNLAIDTEDADNDYLGLFGRIDGFSAEITNIGIENININGGTGSRFLGVLCGWNFGGTITDCYAAGSVTGGVDSRYLGGLCGYNFGGTITNCYATGSVTGDDYLGGLCGYNYFGTIANCYATGSVTGGYDSYYLGGLCGWNEYGAITNCYATGSVTGGDYSNCLGGLCGWNHEGTITNCYFYLLSGPDNSWGTALDDLQMQEANSFVGFDFAGNPNDGEDDYWTVVSGRCPKLTWQTDDGPLPPTSSITTTLTGSGYSYDPFQINSYADFTEFRTNSRLNCGYYILTTDIDLSSKAFITAVISRGFGGHFDGNGHIIRNITIYSYYDGGGLFGSVFASVSNLGIENIIITGGEESYRLGGLCKYNSGTITNCQTSGDVSGNERIAGLVGHNTGTIQYCSSDVQVNGLSYIMFEPPVNPEDPPFEMIIPPRDIGGLVGYNEGDVFNSYANGSIILDICQPDYVNCGGLVGYNFQTGKVSKCYAVTTISGEDGSYLGGLCGYNNDGTLTNCFWDVETSGMTDGVGNQDPDPAGVVGKTTAQMQTQSTFTNEGWDFVGEDVNGTDDFWRMCVNGIDYPKLSWQFLAGDFVCRDGVDLIDFAVLAETWGLSSGQMGYNDLCDLIDDDTIDLDDLAVFVENWLAGK